MISLFCRSLVEGRHLLVVYHTFRIYNGALILQRLKVYIETPGTMDIYTFEAQPGQMVYFDMLEPLAPDLLWRVTDSSEQDIFRMDSGGNQYRTFSGDPGA